MGNSFLTKWAGLEVETSPGRPGGSDTSGNDAEFGQALDVSGMPRSGSIARPMPVRGSWIPDYCLWDNCEGQSTGKGGDLYQCVACETWFELLPPESPGVLVGSQIFEGVTQ